MMTQDHEIPLDSPEEIFETFHQLELGKGRSAFRAHQVAFDKMRERFPHSQEPYLKWGDYLLGTQNYALAETVLRECLELNAESRAGQQARERLSILLFATGDYEGALEEMQKLLAFQDNYSLRRRMILTLHRLGQDSRSIRETYALLHTYHQIDRELLSLLGEFHLRTGEFEDALMVFHHLLQSDTRDLAAYGSLRQVQTQLAPRTRTSETFVPAGLPEKFISLQSYANEYNRKWPHWQRVIDHLELPVVLVESDSAYSGTLDLTGRLTNRELFQVLRKSHLHLTEDLYTRRFSRLLEIPTVVVGSPHSPVVFNDEFSRHLPWRDRGEAEADDGGISVKMVLESISLLGKAELLRRRSRRHTEAEGNV